MYGDEQPQEGSARLVPLRPALATARVLVDAAPGRGDDCIRLNLAPDMRHDSAFSERDGDA